MKIPPDYYKITNVLLVNPVAASHMIITYLRVKETKTIVGSHIDVIQRF